MPEHPNVDGIRRVFAAFGGGDKRALFDVIHEDAVWLVPGTAPVSRIYRGRDEVFGLFKETRRLTDGSYRSELRWALADDAHAFALYRASGRGSGGGSTSTRRSLIDLDGGRWRRIVAVPADPAAFGEFWA